MIGQRFCSLTERQLATAALSQWPDGDVSWTLVGLLPDINEDELHEACEWAFGMWAEVCGITPRHTDRARDARILIGSRRIDAPGGVLAEAELPQPGLRQTRLWFDTSETWTTATPRQREIALRIVAAHELGHSLGLGHAPEGSRNVLAPVYNPTVNSPGDWDTAELRRRYGPRRAAPTPIPTPTPAPTPAPAPTGGDTPMGNLGMLLKLLATLGPLLDWLGKNQATVATVLEILKKIAGSFSGQPQALNMSGMSKDQLRGVLAHASGFFSLLASMTPTTTDDTLAAVFAQAAGTDWLLDLFLALLGGGKITEEMVAQAAAEVAAA